MLLVEVWRDSQLVGTSEFESEDLDKKTVTFKRPITGIEVGDKLVYRWATPEEMAIARL